MTPDQDETQVDLLSLLDSDPRRAEEKYWLLRRKLVNYFQWNNGPEPEDMADDTILRGVQRIAGGATIYVDDPNGYFFGIARNVLKEGWKRKKPESIEDEAALEEVKPVSNPILGLQSVETRVLLAECLAALPVQERNLIVRYFAEGPDALQNELQITANAMRIRVHRVKRKIVRFCGVSRGN